MEFTLSVIHPRDRYHTDLVNRLLEQEDIKRDAHLDYTIGLFYQDDLVATGSSFQNTLRCFAVDSKYQGYALMNTLVSELLSRQNEMGYTNSFVYTKKDSGKFFESLGFEAIADTDQLVFLENRKGQFQKYIQGLQDTSRQFMQQNPSHPAHTAGESATIAAIVMNANPFTLGHQYLVEKASQENDLLHLFIVSDDASLVPFSVRKKLVLEGTAHLHNIIYHETGSYMISQSVFPSYFIQDADEVILQQAKLDVEVFTKIAQQLHIGVRYVGTEPYSRVTGLYNQVLAEKLPQHGIHLTLVERKTEDEQAISASRVRALIHQNKIAEIQQLVPPSTYAYFTGQEAQAVIEKIQQSEDVIHY